MRRVLISLFSIGVIAIVAVFATQAFFNDTETSVGNVLVAGALDLKIDNTCYYNGQACLPVGTDGISTWGGKEGGEQCSCTWQSKDLGEGDVFFSFHDLKPGDWEEDTISVNVDNPSWLCANFKTTRNADNTCTEPEQAAVGGEGGACVDPNGPGELAENLHFVFWRDDGDNVFEENEREGVLTEGTGDTLLNTSWALADSTTLGGPIPADTIYYIGKFFCFGDITANPVPQGINSPTQGSGFLCDGRPVDNKSQTDSLEGDVSFYAEQFRHNENFVCAGTQRVGAALGDYVAPAPGSCAETVTGTESIQAAIDAATTDSGETVCVDSTYDKTGDNVAIRISKNDVTVAALTRGIDLDVPVVLDNDGTKITGFTGFIGQAESPAEQAAFYIDGDAENVVISFNDVLSGTGAVVLTETGGTNNGGLIANNVLSGATQGIYTNPHTGTLTIEYNDIDNNVAGIGGLMGAVVRYNEFEHTVAASEAIGVDPTHDANPATVSFNNFLDGTKLNTYGPIAGDVSAENNFWGPNGGAAQTGGTDEVDFTPEAGAAYPHN